MTAAGVHLDTDALQQHLRQLSQTGQQVAAACQNSAQTIASGEAAIGTGPLADAFRRPYTAASQAVRTAAERIPALYRQLAEVGASCAADYARRDADAAGAMSAVRR
ncbi:type VII secretion target [Amycolatopsis silviterrae]|uniref:Type VII secretion target n=1 Tax=Amycolatopsis silviterrae TaxID=1656914 RepID=A0ABW5H3D6_9PSEU